MIDLRLGDCLEVMKSIPDNSIDMVLTDPPYGTTACKWDTVIPFEPMWKELKRITKDNGAICLFGSEPFSSHLRINNLKMFKYDWIWEKDQGTMPMNAPFRPIIVNEFVHVFSKFASTYSKKGSMCYYPVKTQGKYYPPNVKKPGKMKFHTSKQYTKGSNERYPRSVLKYKTERGLHPTQKPVALLEYLIKTYTLKSETVLDFTMGSGSTGVACKNLNRKFIGIEKEEKYFEIAKERINQIS